MIIAPVDWLPGEINVDIPIFRTPELGNAHANGSEKWLL
jgi:hypothetical protein